MSPTNLTPVDFDPFATGDLVLTAPATAAQKELWTATRLGDDANCAFNESVTLWLRGSLDECALRRALDRLVDRHQALRSTIDPRGELLCVAANGSMPLTKLDLGPLPEEEAKAAFERAIGEQAETAFDLAHGPLIRSQLVRFGASEHALIIVAHHIVCDGWSTGVLLRELGLIYGALVAGRAPELPAATPYSQYAKHLTARDDSAHLAWWLERFEGEIPTLELPVDHRRPKLRSWASRRVDVVWPPALVDAVRGAGASQQSSLFATLLSGWLVLLHRLTGQTDLVVAVPSAGQSMFEGGETLVGHCVNALPIRATVVPGERFSELLARTRSAVLDAFDHQAITFGELLQALPLKRDPGRVPLVSVQFNLDRALDGRALELADLDVEVQSNPRHYEGFELFVNLTASSDGLAVECQYNTALFDERTVRARLDELRRLLAAAAADPSTAVAELPLLSDETRRTVVETWNETDQPWPPATVHGLFEAQAAETPDAVAVRDAEGALTYAEVDLHARNLACTLAEMGVSPGDLVGVAVARTRQMIPTLLGVLKSGAAYVPLDPEYPVDRIAYVLEDSGAKVLLTEASVARALPAVTAKLVQIDELVVEPGRQPPADLQVDPSALAYVIYTSGSTGRPKGVAIEHRSVANFVRAMAREPGMGSHDVLVAVVTLSFDISGFELYVPLSVGAQVVVADVDTVFDGKALAALIERAGATVLQATPATYRLLLDSGWKGRRQMKAVVGGEVFPPALAERLLPRVGELWNAYGPTEATIWSTLHRITEVDGAVPIGRPIANTTAYVLDPASNPVGAGVPGALYLGGVQLARGYHRRPELTAESFVANPFGSGKLYCTGDIARWRHDGALVYERRGDTQVKVRGFRIELGEIETVLAKHPAVAAAVANVWQATESDARLVGYYVAIDGEPIDASALREHLGAALPAYMVPQHFVCVAAIPLTPNGKADRKALPPPALQAAASHFVAPRTETERVLASAWSEVLGIARIGVTDDFFELGGHSLLATRLVAQLSEALGLDLPLRRVFASSRLEDLAKHIDAVQGLTAPADQGDMEELVF